MKTKTKTRYEYDPVRRRLVMFEGSKTRGGFQGEYAEEQYNRLMELGEDISLVCMDEIIQRSKVRQIRAIWKTLGIDDMRDVILEGYGVPSTADLLEHQLDELIAEYGKKAREATNTGTNPREGAKRKALSNVLTTLGRLGVYSSNGDWAAVNNYVMSKRFAKYDRLGRPKLLYQMTTDELNTLNKQLHAALTWKIERMNELGSIAKMN